jgi:hypothetical protein
MYHTSLDLYIKISERRNTTICAVRPRISVDEENTFRLLFTSMFENFVTTQK